MGRKYINVSEGEAPRDQRPERRRLGGIKGEEPSYPARAAEKTPACQRLQDDKGTQIPFKGREQFGNLWINLLQAS